MSGITKYIVAAGAVLTIASPVLAASIERSKPSNFVVWAFLALCASIIVAQVFPLIRRIIEEAEIVEEKSRSKQQEQIN